MDTVTTSADKHEYKLIMTIVNRGFADEVMDAARDAGATGGTVAQARGTGAAEVKFFGIKIEPEKEIVLILAENALCLSIMDNISKHAGLQTHGSGICFALPVDHVTGVKPFTKFNPH